ncbi:hypothetical protein CPB84DRAFT_1843853 [Gymnopilus junonius]|uniref:Protein kinase domain-containing protein n=1 Tax=Gymnopilus junonius TaxID=109634 RepID=A0A9P5NWC0_GYMJU|nr:hypothetical protein CPB84DRAFT_1843853 [Gymnopilus junonius]
MLPPGDPFLPVFHDTFETNYNPELLQSEVTIESLAPQSSPVDFYDRHIAPHLVLDKVIYLPEITHLFSKTCQVAVENFLQAGHRFTQAGYNTFPLQRKSSVFRDASFVAEHYNRFTGELCFSYASKLALHPYSTSWDTAVFMMVMPETVFPHLRRNLGLHVNDSTKAKFYDLSRKYRRLATWDIFAMTYIATAWAKAVVYDSTFIILHCGRYERIDFRHRGSQTLYLSSLIDTVNIRDPSYRKLHIGLHTAIVKDVLDRMDGVEPQLKTGRKRSADHLDNGKEVLENKKKKSSPAAEMDISQLPKGIAKRKLALVSMDYDVEEEKQYPKQKRFKADEYLRLTLRKPVGRGAVGVVHPAALELTLESGDVLKRELNILCMVIFLRKAGIQGVVAVHGMFKDPEPGALGMLMDYAGQNLRHREIDRIGRGEPISTTEHERETFTDTLTSLHDIRSENLLINSQNEVFIVDFDPLP